MPRDGHEGVVRGGLGGARFTDCLSGGTGLEPDPDSPPSVESARSLGGGGEEIVFQFPLNDLCNACTTPYRARVADPVSAAGAFEGTSPSARASAPYGRLAAEAPAPKSRNYGGGSWVEIYRVTVN